MHVPSSGVGGMSAKVEVLRGVKRRTVGQNGRGAAPVGWGSSQEEQRLSLLRHICRWGGISGRLMLFYMESLC